jgi:peptidoglycan-associated lipoprotein
MAACSSKDKDPFAYASGADISVSNPIAYEGSDSIQQGPVKQGTERDFTVNIGDKVHFLADSAELTKDARDILASQAEWLNQYPDHTITIEGHSDERGTREYNLGLAARRAQVVMEFFISKGISAERLRTISYGKERPVAICDDISCWSQNRRGVILLNRNG